MGNTTFRPMKGEKIDLGLVKYPTMGSPKFDGIRCAVKDGVALSASCNPIPNKFIQTCLGHKDFEGLDGELIVGSPTAEDVFLKSTSGVMAVKGTPDVTFFVFDNWCYEDTFSERNTSADYRLGEIRRLQRHSSVKLSFVTHKWIHSEAELIAYRDECIAKGYEGIILRDPDSPYKFGYATAKEGWFWKDKPKADMEVEILEVIEQMANNNKATINEAGRSQRSSAKAGKTGKGTAGALMVRKLGTDIVFKTGWGVGYNAKRKQEIWDNREKYIGTIGVVEHIDTGAKASTGIPRSPRWKGPRHLDDLTEKSNCE